MNKTKPSGPAILLGRHHDITAFASTDESRFAMCGVHFDPEKCVLEATNGSIAIRVPACSKIEDFPSVKAGGPTLQESIIPTAAFKRSLGDIPKGGNLPILNYMHVSGNADGKVTMVANDLETEQAVTAKAIDVQYPDLSQAWPTDAPKFSIKLSARLLKILATYADQHGKTINSKDVAIRFDFTDDLSPVRFSFLAENPLNETVKAEGLVCPMRMS